MLCDEGRRSGPVPGRGSLLKGRDANQGVPCVPFLWNRANAGLDGYTSRCSLRCSLGVPSLPVIKGRGAWEHLWTRDDAEVFLQGVPCQTLINARFHGIGNTGNTGNTCFEAPKATRP